MDQKEKAEMLYNELLFELSNNPTINETLGDVVEIAGQLGKAEWLKEQAREFAERIASNI